MNEIDDELVKIARSKVTRDPYPDPTPTLEIEISEKRKEITSLVRGDCQRPLGKDAYFRELASKNDELSGLITRNSSIILENEIARKAVDDKYNSDFLAECLDTDNQWQAIRVCCGRELDKVNWYLLEDSCLSPEDKIVAKAYRKSLMDLKKNFPDFKSASPAYFAIVAGKPKWELW